MQYIGQRTKFMSTVAAMAIVLGSAASGQALRNAEPPAEFPPASFTGNQYVDSRGCVYVRAGISGATEWVPRVNRERDQLCGFQPTQVAGTTTTAPSFDAPNPLDTPVAGLPDRDPVPRAEPQVAAATPAPPVNRPAPRPVVAPEPAPVATAAPSANAPRVMPTSTDNAVNPLTGRPVVAAPTPAPAPVVQTARPSPRVITPPEVQPEPRVLTRAEACEGLFGVQPNMISQRTGEPVNCGPRPAPPPVIAQAPVVEAQPEVPRMTRAQACADAAATGRRYMNASTGEPIVCDAPAQPTTATAPTAREGMGLFAVIRAGLGLTREPYTNPLDIAPGATVATLDRPVTATTSPVSYTNPLDAPPGSTFATGPRSELASNCAYGDLSLTALSGTYDVRCGPQAQSPSGTARRPTVQPETVTRARTSRTGHEIYADLFGQEPPPYSNPPAGTPVPNTGPPAGFVRAWDDGRLNQNRGLPDHSVSGYATQRTVPAAQTARVSTRVAPQPTQRTPARAEQISGNRYVQVGTFADRAQAQAIAQSLRAQGLPMRIGVYTSGAQQMRIVLAGPFANDRQLNAALGTARSAGHTGAFTRQ